MGLCCFYLLNVSGVQWLRCHMWDVKRCQAKSPWRQSLPLSYPAPPHYVPLTARAGMKWAPDRTRVSLGGGSRCAAVSNNSAPRGCTAGMAVIPGCGSQLSVPMALQGVCVSSQGTGVCVHLSTGTCTPQQALEAVLEQDQVGWLPYSQPQQSLHLSSQHSWGRGGISLSWELGTSWISSMTWVWGQSSQLRGSYTPWVQLLLCNVLHLIPEIKIHEVSWFWKQGCVTKSRWLKGNFILNELKGT